MEVEDLTDWEINRNNRQAMQAPRECGAADIRQFSPDTRRLIARHRDGTEIMRTYVGADGHHVQMTIVWIKADEASPEDIRLS